MKLNEVFRSKASKVAVGGVSGILIGSVGMSTMGFTVLDEISEAGEDIHSYDGMSFADAFAEARAELGPGEVFEWNGNAYSTYTAEEWNEAYPESTLDESAETEIIQDDQTIEDESIDESADESIIVEDSTDAEDGDDVIVEVIGEDAEDDFDDIVIEEAEDINGEGAVFVEVEEDQEEIDMDQNLNDTDIEVAEDASPAEMDTFDGDNFDSEMA